MQYDRRKFLSESLTAVGAFGVLNSNLGKTIIESSKIRAPAPYRGAMAIMQGLTSTSSAEFIMVTESKKNYGYQVVSSDGTVTLPVRITRRETRSTSNWGIEKTYVSGLALSKSYLLRIIDPVSGKAIDERNFTALDTESPRGKYVVASCMKDSSDSLREVMWDAVNNSNPQLVILAGDTCYADNEGNDGSDADYWRRYIESRTLLSHFRQKKLIPTLATWDDHDFGGNNFDSSWEKKDMTKELFEIFWHNEVPSPLLQKGPGVAQVFSAFGQRFFMMDDRTWRSPREGVSKPVQWGEAQEEFLFEKITENNRPAMLINGSQFFGGYLKKDAFEYWQADNLKSICSQLALVEAPVVFVGGDVHFSEFMNIEPEILGYPTIEITSSSIHSTTIPFNHLRKKNKRRIDATSAHNFVLIDSSTQSAGWSLKAQSLGKDLKEYMNETFLIQR